MAFNKHAKMFDVLHLINSPRNEELKRIGELLPLYRHYGSRVLFLTRHAQVPGESVAIFGADPFFFNLKSFSSNFVSRIVSILEEELSFDRQFHSSKDFSNLNKLRAPRPGSDFYKLLALKMEFLLTTYGSSFISIGAPDNWISTSLARIALVMDRKIGFSTEIVPNSNTYLVCDGLHFDNRKITNSILQWNGRSVELPLRGLQSNNDIHDRSKTRKSIASRIVSTLNWQFRAICDLIKCPRLIFYRYEYAAVKVPFLSLGRDLLIAVRRLINGGLYSILSKRGISIFKRVDHRCIYFLHVSPEAATLVLGREFGDQLDILHKLKNSLDARIFLFTKEHPAQDLGYRPVIFYLRLRLMGIHILPVSLKIDRDFRSSDVVATISGSVVMETVNLGNRVILCSTKCWLRIFENVTLLEELLSKTKRIEFSSRHLISRSLEEYFGALVNAGVLVSANGYDEAEAQLPKFL